MRRITILGVLVAMAAVSMGTAQAIGLSGEHGCVATAGSSCAFVGDPAGFPSGAASATTGTYTVSHQGTSGTVVDISGSGPGAQEYYGFDAGVLYTLTVNADGTGVVTAGSPMPTLPPVPPVPPLPPVAPLTHDVYPTHGTPIVFECTGTGGWEQTSSGPRWRSHTREVPNPLGNPGSPCAARASDTAAPLTDPPVSGDPTPFAAFERLYGWLFWSQRYSTPVGRGELDIDAVGDFACGEGTLTVTGAHSAYTNTVFYEGGPGGSTWWSLDDLTVEFSSGVGQMTGTVHEIDTKEVRDLSGTMIVDDGAAAGQCNDSAGASNVAFFIELTPQ